MTGCDTPQGLSGVANAGSVSWRFAASAGRRHSVCVLHHVSQRRSVFAMVAAYVGIICLYASSTGANRSYGYLT